MPQNALEETLRVEQEVQARIAAERERAAIWVQEEKAALSQKNLARQRELYAGNEAEESRLRAELAAKAEAMLRRAEERAAFLEALDQAALEPLIHEALRKIIPRPAP